MQTPKSFAALSSTLLARKGQAKPAMRPQGYGHLPSHEDLGWNDMGHSAYRPVVTSEMLPPPTVLMQQDALAETFDPPLPTLEPELEPEPDMPVPQPKAETNGKTAHAKPMVKAVKVKPDMMPAPRTKGAGRAKAAFTLRLDPERHLRLRLACAVDHRSAQQIVTQALDSYLAAMPELDALAGKVRTKQ